MDPRLLVDPLAEGFRAHSRGAGPALGMTFRLSGGSLTSSALGSAQRVPVLSHKLESRLTTRSPVASGLVSLYDAASGQLLCLLESSHLSAVSSALAAALATDLLAPASARRLAVVGTGVQGWSTLRFLLEMRSLEEITLFDLQRRKSRAFSERLKKYPELEVRVCDSLSDTVIDAEIVLCATWSRQPILFPEMLLPGVHVTALGSDQVGKREIDEQLLRDSSFYCDDRELAVTTGGLWEIPSADELVAGELGQVLDGKVPGRVSPEQTTIYAPVGLPFQDLLAAWVAYRRALDKGLGRRWSLGLL